MREIKFRGLRKDGKGWVYGVPFEIKEEGICFIIDNCQSSFLTQEDTSFQGKGVIPETASQFTGLLDKNGKEIYEGDVVIRSGKDNCIVEWRSDKCKYDFKYKVDLMSPQWMGGIDNHYSKNELEVIGNIHENKDLI